MDILYKTCVIHKNINNIGINGLIVSLNKFDEQKIWNETS